MTWYRNLLSNTFHHIFTANEFYMPVSSEVFSAIKQPNIFIFSGRFIFTKSARKNENVWLLTGRNQIARNLNSKNRNFCGSDDVRFGHKTSTFELISWTKTCILVFEFVTFGHKMSYFSINFEPKSLFRINGKNVVFGQEILKNFLLLLAFCSFLM